MIHGLDNMPLGAKMELLKHLEQALGGEKESSNKEPMAELNANAMAAQLKDFYESLCKTHDFKEGDLIQAKPDLLSRGTKLRKGQPLIVVEMLKEPVIDEDSEASSCDFREKLDMRVGWITDGRFIIHHFASEKFEPFLTE